MTKPLLANCDHCGNLTTINFKIKNHPNKLQETYFNCVVCDKHYTCFVTDKTVRKLQKEKDNTNKYDVKTREHLQLKINKRMNKLKQELMSNG